MDLALEEAQGLRVAVEGCVRFDTKLSPFAYLTSLLGTWHIECDIRLGDQGL
jgi:hypothetical protein